MASDDGRDVLSQAALTHYVADVCPEGYLEELLSVVREHVDGFSPSSLALL